MRRPKVSVQQECDHQGSLERVTKYDPNFYNVIAEQWGMHIFLGQRCKKCGQFLPRPPGDKCEVCYNCGGQMQFEGAIPGRGERVHVYKCKKCGHLHGNV